MSKNRSVQIGEKYNRLTVMSFEGGNNGYTCQCECGKITSKVRGWELKTGGQKSCGCLIREKTAERRQLPELQGLKNEILHNYQGAAKRRGYDFLLTKEEFYNLIQSNCYYCGAKPSMIHKGTPRIMMDTSDFKYNGIDRKDNAQGYTKDNCVPCCKICNTAKASLTSEEWFDWLHRICIFNKIVEGSTTSESVPSSDGKKRTSQVEEDIV